jgi:hypothetical protein
MEQKQYQANSDHNVWPGGLMNQAAPAAKGTGMSDAIVFQKPVL